MAVSIPFIDLREQYRSIRSQIDRAVHRVLASGQFILGAEGEALEREVAASCGTHHAVAVASGTDALELALRACGIGEGNEVITSVYSFFATAEAILAVGATPVFVDIDPETYSLDPARVIAKITRRTTAILPVHLYGHPCDMRRLVAIARRYRLKLIEDCAQAIGARDHGRAVGGFGDAAALSFYPTKNLGGYGDGGMVLTNHARVADQVRLLRNHGGRTRYRHLAIGTNSRLDELQAAVLRVKLRHLNRWIISRRRLARRYAAAFRRYHLDRIIVPRERPGSFHVYHLYTIRVPGRDRIARELARHGIGTQVAYPSTLASQPALKGVIRRSASYPVAEAASRTVLSLPMHPELSAAAISRIVTSIARIVRGGQ